MGGCLEIPYRVKRESSFYIFSDMTSFEVVDNGEVQIIAQGMPSIQVKVGEIFAVGLIAERILDYIQRAVAVRKAINS